MNRRSFIKRLSAIAVMPLIPMSKEEFKKEYPENNIVDDLSSVSYNVEIPGAYTSKMEERAMRIGERMEEVIKGIYDTDRAITIRRPVVFNETKT